MNKLRLLALTTSYPLHPGGSAGVFVRSLYRGLSSNCTIDVVCPAGLEGVPAASDDTVTDVRIHGVRYAPRQWRTLAQQSGGVVTAVRRAPWRVLLLPVMLGALFWRCWRCAGKVDLIHANWAVCGVVAGVVGRLRGKPVITTLRGSDVTRAAQSRLDRLILGLAVRHSRIVICVSEAMAGQLSKLYPKRAVDVHACLNGVDERFLEIERQPAAGDVLRVLAAGNLIRLKGFDVLVEALARARHRDGMHVCVAGGGPEREALLALAASLGMASRFDFAGSVPVDDMPARFATADVFVLSSRSEGRPNVVAEALASGLPVISTDLDGVEGMVADGDNGWLVAVDDAAALAAALDTAFEDRAELQRRGARARATARARIGTWADTARCYTALFQMAVGSNVQRCPPCAE
jgi:glycosyltransferase involved in cell wall biosynthesis